MQLVTSETIVCAIGIRTRSKFPVLYVQSPTALGLIKIHAQID